MRSALLLTGMMTMVWIGGASKAQATSCVPAVQETFQLMPESPSPEIASDLPSWTKNGAIELQRSVIRRVNHGLPEHCLELGSGDFYVSLERVQAIVPAPETAQQLQALEAQRTPRAWVCGSLPYRAIHPGVYKYSQACSFPVSQAPRGWPEGASVTVNETRSGVVLDFARQEEPQRRNYRVESASFPDRSESGCSFRRNTQAPFLSGLVLIAGLGGLRRRIGWL